MTIEEEGDDFGKSPSPVSYRNAFDFPELSGLVTEGVLDGTAVSKACFEQGTSPVLGVSSAPRVRTEFPSYPTVINLHDTNSAHKARNVAVNLPGDVVSPTAAVVNSSRERLQSSPDSNSISAHVPTPVDDLVGMGPVVPRALTTPRQHSTIAKAITNTADSTSNKATMVAVAAAARAMRSVGPIFVDSDTPRTDGVVSSRCSTANASCQTPSHFPSNRMALKIPFAVEQYPMHLSDKNSSASQEVSFLFDGNRVDGGKSDSSSRCNAGLHHGTRCLAMGHSTEGGKLRPTSSPQLNAPSCPSSKQLLFAKTAPTKTKALKERYPIKVPRKPTNVHGTLQDALRYVPYRAVSLGDESPPVRESSRITTEENVNLAPLYDTANKQSVDKYQLLPMFIQMFPCELRDRTIIVLNRVVEATCGPDIATVVGIEPRSETSFITLVRTNGVWQLIHKLRCRVLMDRHGFWYAENMEQYLRLKEYCESVRRLPQQMRHFQTDGLPCMPLVVELS
ncbi:uncharacterized protein Tco025E_08243, partial [Trypanosoma conorhini]